VGDSESDFIAKENVKIHFLAEMNKTAEPSVEEANQKTN